eukprot:CAMPEP_0202113732 /NCGR_PEP_ID=MMETSP0965-20130614/34538_1 /ASSEMBLY_ACC=CAM_ASM_000507 /TAXON_ID=4773 /ORGANISM="Schizochytrium aggregatum, Strain ATCC28209" /LENGTH=103 /DNA_ID=CAMNT_0048683371 /DNA_START=59 /DNA_END=369 /DNA_ORIENTATION=+
MANSLSTSTAAVAFHLRRVALLKSLDRPLALEFDEQRSRGGRAAGKLAEHVRSGFERLQAAARVRRRRYLASGLLGDDDRQLVNELDGLPRDLIAGDAHEFGD